MTEISLWQPLVNIRVIKKRADLYQQIREFMRERDILEVDTPVLSHYGISDPYIDSFQTVAAAESLYLHTSPEFCMKRLLAAGIGAIYQIAHVFRDEQVGRCHNIEFAMLEWYRPAFDYYQLMDELGDLLTLLGLERPKRMTYAAVFQKILHIDPHRVEVSELCQIANANGWQTTSNDRHELLDFAFSSIVMKQLSFETPLIIYDYPECMAALATIKSCTPAVSERFELFIDGMEIANGFNELIEAKAQKARFEADLVKRRVHSKQIPPIDPNFLAALESGLPKCAGIAIGLERLLMVLLGSSDIKEVSVFTLVNN